MIFSRTLTKIGVFLDVLPKDLRKFLMIDYNHKNISPYTAKSTKSILKKMQSFLKKLKRFYPTLHELFKNARNQIPKSFNHLKNSSWWFSKTSWRIIEKVKENLTVFLDVFCVTAYIPANRVSTYYISITCYGRNRFFSLHSCHSDFTCRNDRNYRLSCKCILLTIRWLKPLLQQW